MGSMKVHQLARGFWEHEPSLTLGCKRLRPLAPKLANTDHSVTSFDLKSFIRPDSGPRKLASSDEKKDSPQVRTTDHSYLASSYYHYFLLHLLGFCASLITPNIELNYTTYRNTVGQRKT